jgi:hypothetical protein
MVAITGPRLNFVGGWFRALRKQVKNKNRIALIDRNNVPKEPQPENFEIVIGFDDGDRLQLLIDEKDVLYVRRGNGLATRTTIKKALADFAAEGPESRNSTWGDGFSQFLNAVEKQVVEVA